MSCGFIIYSDSAPEFRKVCKWSKILDKLATPNSDEGNARCERLMGVLGDIIRTVLSQSGLPLVFWCFAAEYAADVYNMTVIPYIILKPHMLLDTQGESYLRYRILGH